MATDAKRSVSVFGLIGSAFDGVSRVFRTIKYLYFGIIILTLLGFMWSNPMDRMNAIGVPFETTPARP